MDMKELQEPKQWADHDYGRALKQGRWWLLAPFFVFGLLGFAVQWVWPPSYRSEALIQVREQVVPPKFVTPNVQITAADRLQAMTQQILSRSRLQHLIEADSLYPSARMRLNMDALIVRMRKDITIQPVEAADRPGGLSSFRISYLAPTPQLAQRVVNELTSLFIEDNLQARAQESAGTTDFLQSQLQQAQQTLAAQERQLQAYKMRYLGQLPEQEQSNLEILSSLRAQYSAGAEDLDRAQQEKTYWQSLQAAYAHGTASGDAADSPQAHIRQLRAKLAALRADHTALYPDVVATQRELNQWQAIAREAGEKAGPAKSVGSPASAHSEPAEIEAASRLGAGTLAIQRRRAAQADLAAKIRRLQRDLALTPVRGQELTVLLRNVANAQQGYEALLEKVSQSQLATDLEQSQQGERFQVIDSASLPRHPAIPNRPLILLAGWLLGLIAGAGALVMRAASDHTLRGEESVTALTAVPVLATIGVLSSPRRQQLALLKRAVEGGTLACLLLAAVGSVAYTIAFMS